MEAAAAAAVVVTSWTGNDNKTWLNLSCHKKLTALTQ